jgi:hypothetical protein
VEAFADLGPTERATVSHRTTYDLTYRLREGLRSSRDNSDKNRFCTTEVAKTLFLDINLCLY